FRDGSEGVELSPRTWATGVNFSMKNLHGEDLLNAVSGMIGEENAIEFFDVVKRLNDLPDIEKLISGEADWNPVGKDPSEIYLVLNGIVKKCFKDARVLPVALKAASRLGNEYFYLCVSLLIKGISKEDVVKALIDSGTYNIVEQAL
ncbi:MAG: hypothetical protein QXV22_03135, partial [Thermoplasmataceae archaeon]